jgi:hypothetical protein
MAVVEQDKRNETACTDMMIDLQIPAWIPLTPYRARSGALKGDEGAGLFQVMCDPYEWKCAVKFALVIFIGFAALAPALTPDQKTLAAKINHQTLKAAAAIKSPTR